jgi:hypothetical protein
MAEGGGGAGGEGFVNYYVQFVIHLKSEAIKELYFFNNKI